VLKNVKIMPEWLKAVLYETEFV